MTPIKEEILNLWKLVKRPNIDTFLKWLESTDFFTAPCSTKFHGAVPGGLAQHSLNVYNLLKDKIHKHNLQKIITKENAIVTGLGHDLCKIGVYSKDTRPATEKQLFKLKAVSGDNYKDYSMEKLTMSYCSALIDWEINGRTGSKPENFSYTFTENIPIGHGEKSIYILQKFIPLEDVEAIAIRWHMAFFDFAVQAADYPTGYSFRDALSKHALVGLLMLADLESSMYMEREWSL